MDSVNRVDEKKRVHKTSAGVNGSNDVHAASVKEDSAGDSGARMGNRVIRI